MNKKEEEEKQVHLSKKLFSEFHADPFSFQIYKINPDTNTK